MSVSFKGKITINLIEKTKKKFDSSFAIVSPGDLISIKFKAPDSNKEKSLSGTLGPWELIDWEIIGEVESIIEEYGPSPEAFLRQRLPLLEITIKTTVIMNSYTGVGRTSLGSEISYVLQLNTLSDLESTKLDYDSGKEIVIV